MNTFIRRFILAKKDDEASTVKTFIDRTDQNWYVKKGTSKISFCDTIDDLIEGKSESYEFVETYKSSRFIKKQ
jgi:hypothetical protein